MSVKRTTRFWFKNTFERKHNRYVFVTLCDKDGIMLQNKLPEVPEFFEIIGDQIWQYSDCISHENWLDSGLFKITTKKFLKIIAPNMLQKLFGKTNVERARVPGKNLYMFQNMHDLLYREETFFNEGVVWVFGNPDMLEDFKSVIDEIRVCKCNCSFEEMYEGEQFGAKYLGQILNELDFGLKHSVVTDAVKRNLDLLKRNKQPKQQPKVEILDNGMKIIKESEVEKPKKLDLTGIYDYEIQTYY